jgi:hypothetical protein
MDLDVGNLHARPTVVSEHQIDSLGLVELQPTLRIGGF